MGYLWLYSFAWKRYVSLEVLQQLKNNAEFSKVPGFREAVSKLAS
jgi:hypothetical protein